MAVAALSASLLLTSSCSVIEEAVEILFGKGHTLTKNDLEHGATLKDMNMPQGTRVIMIKREEDYIVPTGKLTLKEGDKMVILVSEEDKEENQEPISE